MNTSKTKLQGAVPIGSMRLLGGPERKHKTMKSYRENPDGEENQTAERENTVAVEMAKRKQFCLVSISHEHHS